MDRHRLSEFFKLMNWQYGKCLAVPPHCSRPPIRAHSVQNAQVLDLLASDGHVTGITRRINSEGGPVIEFGDVGRNFATTFAGLCAEHDRATFAPTRPICTRLRSTLLILAAISPASRTM